MSNHAALIRQENAGKTVTRRGKHFIEFDLGNGQRRFVTTIEPLHYGAILDQEYDTTFIPDTGAWQWKLETCRYHIHARNVLNAGDTVQWLDPTSGETCTLQPLALNWVDNLTDSRQQITQPQAVTAVASDCSLYWQNGYGAGRHFRYTAHPVRLVKEVIIDASANLPAPTISNPFLEIEFILKNSSGVTLYVDGATWDSSTKVNTVNRIEFRTAGGQVVWLFEKPTIRDASGNIATGIIQLRRQGATRYVTARFDKAWIDTATFPISLDPTFTDGYGGDVTTAKDAFAKNWDVDSNFDGLDFLRSDGSSVIAWITFNLGSLSGTCNSATIYFYKNAVEGAGTWDAYDMVAANRAWAEATATWNHRSGTTDWAGGHTGCGTSGTDHSSTSAGSWSHPVGGAGTEETGSLNTTIIQGRFGSTLDLVLKCDYDRNLCSSDHATTGYRPKLVVDYTAAGAGPYAFGEQNPTLGETAVSWQTWSNGAGSPPPVTGDADWGKLHLDMSGAQGRSAVYDLGSSHNRTITVTENRYGTGTGSATLQIRGDTVTFNQDDANPAWETYTVPVVKNWQFIQVREVTAL